MKKMILNGIKSGVVIVLFLFMFGTSFTGLFFGLTINIHGNMDEIVQISGYPGNVYVNWVKPEKVSRSALL